MPRTTTPHLRYLLVLDFEATCDDTNKIVPKEQMEIIEFPTILYDIHDDKVEAVFHEYIRPSLHPQLTEFCTNLTGIQQNTVDAASQFPDVWQRYQQFLRSHNIIGDEPSSAVFLTCGDWDLKTMLPQQLRLSGITEAFKSSGSEDLKPPFDRWINIKKSYRNFYEQGHPRGMHGMLRHAKMELEGRHHSGIDDCKNILRLAQKMRKDGWKPDGELSGSDVV
ncbi:exonuclease RNase T and DNA polymerase III [Cubamyces sp. BRFM 1775]|nr:exonuclease RNase T and DNA polymerase III [Cubamyces sp. BRFM 1775]